MLKKCFRDFLARTETYTNMKLVIVESPTKAKTITPILGRNYKVKASMGHVRDLPKSGLGVDVAHNFEPEYINTDKSKKVLAELKELAAEADEVILATDPDREGEAISWHLYQVLEGLDKKKTKTVKKSKKTAGTEKESVKSISGEEVTDLKGKYKRVVFHELTKKAIEEAFEHPGELNKDLVDAQQARRVLDRLVGYKLSPLLWKKVRFGLSAGRVQSVAVRLVVDRERERLAFKPEEYWSIEGNFENSAKHKITAALTEKDSKKLEVTNKEQADKIQKDLSQASFEVSEIKKTERQRKAYPPLKTSTLQQIASNVFGFTAKKTMIAAQKLFEQGFITYHRTDSLNLSPQFIEDARAFVTKEIGQKYLPTEGATYKTKDKSAQEAHEAIRPTDVSNFPGKMQSSKLTEDEYKVYSLIWKRALESQMLPAVYDQTTVHILSDNKYGFRTTGSIVKFMGWLAVGDFLGLDTDSEEIHRLEDFNEGESLKLLELVPDQHFTQPPARYSDATLVKALEELGIGRPSTYAPTISTIQARGYVTKEGRYFIPSEFAYVVNDLLVEHFPNIVDFQFTAEMEAQFDEIAEGKKEWVPIIREFYTPFEKVVLEKDKTLQKAEVTNLGQSTENCPDCGKPLVYKLGKYGKFLSCSGFPECEFAKPLVDTIASDGGGAQGEGSAQIDFGPCANCADGRMILRQGRFGKFIGCSNYPKCKTIQKYFDKIGMKCPKCNDGDVVVKKSKRGKFFGCSRYPDCDYTSWKNPKPNAETEESTNSTPDTGQNKSRSWGDYSKEQVSELS